MSYSDLGVLTPSETQQGPNYLAAARAEGTKKANYLSSMDQYYAGLEASTVAQDKEIEYRTWETEFKGELQEKGWEWQDIWNQEQVDLGYAGIESNERISNRDMDLREREFDWRSDFEEDKFEWEQDESDWIKDQYTKENGGGGYGYDPYMSASGLRVPASYANQTKIGDTVTGPSLLDGMFAPRDQGPRPTSVSLLKNSGPSYDSFFN